MGGMGLLLIVEPRLCSWNTSSDTHKHDLERHDVERRQLLRLMLTSKLSGVPGSINKEPLESSLLTAWPF